MYEGLSMKYTGWENGSPSNTYDCLCLRLLSAMSEWLWLNVDCSASFRFIFMSKLRIIQLSVIGY